MTATTPARLARTAVVSPRAPRIPGAAGRFGPNWYAAVMGTAIVANGAHALPQAVQSRELTDLAAAVWALSLLLLVALAATRLTARRLPDRIRALDDPATAVFLGCPPMAMLAVGAGALGAGAPLIAALAGVGTGAGAGAGAGVGSTAGVLLDAGLWTAGTLYGIGVAMRVLYLLIARYRVERGGSAPTWLLPVVAPMVSAALGPALIPHLPAGQAQGTMLAVCVALFGASLLAVLVLLPGIWSRLVHEQPLPLLLVPTLFLVLGPLGQSVTAVTQFARVAPALRGFALVYGVAVFGFAMLWLGVAGSVTLRALREGMPFGMTWWAYTFPVGTCVTGAAGLARMTGLDLFAVLAVALFALLVTAWAVVGARTLRGLASGALIAR
ncbi:tellurite resistance protein TehA-like permease [Streptacidiphilus sp. MAP12-16]|uniref:SLAC1 family transporter n=1 Tax=Streptacidiphilus sp. MAP12-16 TaxID=3156300 RepID=UPI00351243CC